MTEEIVRRAKSVARSIPDDPCVVGVMTAETHGDDALRAVAEIASQVGASRRTLLANLVGGAGSLDAHLGVERQEGLQAVLAEGKRLGQVAVQPGARRFLYLPAGAGGPGGPAPAGRLPEGVLSGIEALADKLREAGGTLLLHVSRDRLDNPDLAGLLDGVVLVGDVAEPSDLPAGLREFGRIALPDADPESAPGGAGEAGPGAEEAGANAEGASPERGEEATPAESSSANGLELVDYSDGASGEADGEEAAPDAGEEAPVGTEEGPAADRPPEEPPAETPVPDGERSGGGWRRHRKRAGPPWGRIAVGVAVIGVLAGGWWLFASDVTGGDASAGGGEAGGMATAAAADTAPPSAEGTADRPDGETGEGETVSSREEAAGDPALDRLAASAPEAPFSVMVASYSTWEDAVSSAEGWSESGDTLYFVAPTPVRGALYYRVLAGALASREEARALNQRLVETGRKESASEWHVRPAGLAFRLGVHGSTEAADRARRELAEQGVPAYVLRAAAGEDTAHVLYAGAYGSPEEAAPLREMLEDAGRGEAELVRRRGGPAP